MCHLFVSVIDDQDLHKELGPHTRSLRVSLAISVKIDTNLPLRNALAGKVELVRPV